QPSGLADWPRPFVFRARNLDGHTIPPGGAFWFDLNVFSLDPNVLSYFVLTFASLAREGLGPRRRKAELQRVASRDQVLYNGCSRSISASVEPVTLDLTPLVVSPTRIRVDFLTPTELKHEHQIATLSRLYGGEVLDIDYQGTNARAAAVRMIRCNLRRLETDRRSSRTGQAHSIGGFAG